MWGGCYYSVPDRLELVLAIDLKILVSFKDSSLGLCTKAFTDVRISAFYILSSLGRVLISRFWKVFLFSGTAIT